MELIIMVAEKISKTDAKSAAKAQKATANPKTIKSKAGKVKQKVVTKETTTIVDPKAASDAWNVLMYPYLTEKSTRMIESQNKLVFIVKDRSSKAQIKKAVEAVFGVKVADVNTTSTMRGEKKAYVRLAPEFKAVDIATKLGMM